MQPPPPVGKKKVRNHSGLSFQINTRRGNATKIKPEKVPFFKPQTSILLLTEMEKMLRKPTFLPGRVKIIQHGTDQPLKAEMHPSTNFKGGGGEKK